MSVSERATMRAIIVIWLKNRNGLYERQAADITKDEYGEFILCMIDEYSH